MLVPYGHCQHGSWRLVKSKKRSKNSILANLSEIVRRFQKCKSWNGDVAVFEKNKSKGGAIYLWWEETLTFCLLWWFTSLDGTRHLRISECFYLSNLKWTQASADCNTSSQAIFIHNKYSTWGKVSWKKVAVLLDFVQITSPLPLIWTTCTTFFARQKRRFKQHSK